MLVDVDDLANAAQARAAVLDFASTFEKEHSVLGLDGHIGTLDHNADGAITIAFSNYTGAGVSSGVAGFFDYRDMLPPSDAEATALPTASAYDWFHRSRAEQVLGKEAVAADGGEVSRGHRSGRVE